MITLSEIEKYDKNKMYQTYDQWPVLSKNSYYSNLEPVNFKDVKHIIFTGMGGSGAVGDILSSIMSKTSTHINIVKGYHLPNTIDSDSLLIATSVSGNTLETLSVLDQAKKRKCKIITFSSGGKMQEYCIKNKIEYRQIPMHNSPRASFPLYVYSVLHVLKDLISIKESDVKESLQYLEKIQKQIGSQNLSANNPSFDLAKWLSDITMIYYPYGLQSAAVRFKNSLQENTKKYAIVEDVIESCHNGIMSWESQSNIKPVLIRGVDDYIKTKELWEIIHEYFQSNNIDYKEIVSTDGSILTKLMCLIYLLDFATIYRSVMIGIDPTPVKSIDFIKSRLNTRT